jgi:hypothetical protein
MGDDDRRLLEEAATGKIRVLRARSVICDLVSRIGDPKLARRIEAELNDAWLRLQLALVAGDPVLVRDERRSCAELLVEARQRAQVSGTGG